MFRKPNKRIFELALEKAELLSDEVWYIGDRMNVTLLEQEMQAYNQFGI